MALIFVTATRWSQAEFEARAPLSRSLAPVHEVTPLELRVFADNTQALALSYNTVIEAAAPDDVLVFVHDDVVVDDWMLGWRLQEALLHFDVVGVAGNQRRQPEQTTWLMLPHTNQWDLAYASGAIMHGSVGHKALTFLARRLPKWRCSMACCWPPVPGACKRRGYALTRSLIFICTT